MNTEFCVTIVPIEKRKRKLEKNSNGDYQCTWCSFSTKNASTISMHIKYDHAEAEGRTVTPSVCNYCDKSFARPTSRDTHIKNFHKIKFYECPHPGCDVIYKSEPNLIGHYGERHIDFFDERCQAVGDNKFKCLTCDILKDNKSKMYRHLATQYVRRSPCKEAKSIEKNQEKT